MVTNSTPLSLIFQSAWKSGSNAITGILAVDDFRGKNRGHMIEITIGRYCDSLLKHELRTVVDLDKYRYITGTGDETGRQYAVIADNLPANSNTHGTVPAWTVEILKSENDQLKLQINNLRKRMESITFIAMQADHEPK